MSATMMNVEQARFNMIEQQIRPWDVLDAEVLRLLSVCKREDFVPAAHKDLAFADIELPIGAGGECGAQGDASQTMLWPKLEARMLQAIDVAAGETVLEIGTGTGYMAALLAAQAQQVISVEIEPGLAAQAKQNLQRAGVSNVSVVLGDGARGWPTQAPYDAIVVSASMPILEKALLDQLKVGGRLLAIVGEAPAMQVQLVTRVDEQNFNTHVILETVVAPLRNATAHEKFVF